MTKFASSFSRINKNHIILRNLGTKFYHKTGSFLAFLVSQKNTQDYQVHCRQNYVEVKLLHSPTKFKKNIDSLSYSVPFVKYNTHFLL